MIFIPESEIKYYTDFCPSFGGGYIRSRIFGSVEAIRKRLKIDLSGSEITELYFIWYSYDREGLVLIKKIPEK